MVELEEAVQPKSETLAAKEYLNQLQQLQADFANYKRRVERQREEEVKLANEELIVKLLPVLDDFGRALKNISGQITNEDWERGMRLVEHHLKSILEKEGLNQIESKGREFDPEVHEAVFTEEGGPDEQGKVSAVTREGYRLHDKVIRPAQVSVVKGIKRESQPIMPRNIPIRRGGGVRWKDSIFAPGARELFL